MSEVVNPNKEAIAKIPTMTLEDLRTKIDEAHAKPVDANDQQKQAERRELQTEAQKRLETLRQSGVNGNLDALEQKIKSLQQGSGAPTQAPSSIAVAPSTPTTPPNVMEKLQFKATEFAVSVLHTLPLPAGLKNQIFEFIAGLNNVTVPLIGKITIPGADLLGDIGELTNVREQMTAFVQQNPSFILDPTIDASVWKAYRAHLKQNPGKPIAELLKDFQEQSKNIGAGSPRIALSLATLLEPKKVLDPMKVAVETTLESAVLKAWGVKTVEFKDGPPTLRNGTLTVRKTDLQMNGEPVPKTEVMELRTLMSRFGNVDTIVLSSDPAIKISWNGEKREITLPTGTKDIVLQSLKEILAQNKNGKFSNIIIKNNDKLGEDIATLTYDKDGVGTLTAPNNINMLKALTQCSALQPNDGEETKWKLDGTTLKRVDPVVSMKKENAPKVS
jgi:hypothetical protein